MGGEPEGAEPPPEPDAPMPAAKKAQLEWHQLKARRGWSDATLVMLLYEFVASRDLFADLNQFMKRK